MTFDTLWTPRQVADALHFATARPIYKLISSGELPAAKLGGRLLVERSDVEALIVARRQPSPRATGGLRGLERS